MNDLELLGDRVELTPDDRLESVRNMLRKRVPISFLDIDIAIAELESRRDLLDPADPKYEVLNGEINELKYMFPEL